MQARGTKQHELVEETPREFPWIESGSFVRDCWSAVEYGGIPEFFEMLALKSTVHWVGACANDDALISCTIYEQLLSYQDPWARDPGGWTGTIKAEKLVPSKYRAFNQNSTQSCAQLLNKSSLTLTRESVLKRWVSGVWLQVELRQQGCSCTRIH